MKLIIAKLTTCIVGILALCMAMNEDANHINFIGVALLWFAVFFSVKFIEKKKDDVRIVKLEGGVWKIFKKDGEKWQ